MTIIVNPTLPDILVNGTIADATQVMANFASIISQINVNAAENGANSSITSLSGLTTPLTIPQGGTGAASFAQYNLLVGNGSSTFALIPPGAAGTFLRINAANTNPVFSGLQNSDVISGLGYQPVQEATGPGQGAGTVSIGWSTASGNGFRFSLNGVDEGYPVMSTSNAAAGYNVTGNVAFSGLILGSGGVYDTSLSNRVWSSGINLNLLTVNGIGYDVIVNTGTTYTEGSTLTLSGRPGTWLCLTSATISPSGGQLYRRIV